MSTGSCIVTALQPPFRDDVMKFEFAGYEKILAVSMQDGAKIIELLGGNNPVGRTVILEAVAPGDEKIRVCVLQ
jgi:hypothetical protein